MQSWTKLAENPATHGTQRCRGRFLFLPKDGSRNPLVADGNSKSVDCAEENLRALAGGTSAFCMISRMRKSIPQQTNSETLNFGVWLWITLGFCDAGSIMRRLQCWNWYLSIVAGIQSDGRSGLCGWVDEACSCSGYRNARIHAPMIQPSLRDWGAPLCLPRHSAMLHAGLLSCRAFGTFVHAHKSSCVALLGL